MAGLCCGIDIGSTNLKVLLLDGVGRTRWVKSVATPRLHDGLGVVTDAAGLIAALESLIIEGWREAGGGEPLAAIATTGIGEDGVGVDASLKPLGHAIAWFDRRAEADALALSRLPEAKAYPAIRFDFIASACKWLWLRRERPQELGGAHRWITLTDYPCAVWSGKPFISETLAARTGCYDVFARDWIPALLAASKAPPLPPVLKAGQIVGTMANNALIQSGAASAATLLVAGGHDHPVASSAIRRIHPQARVDSLGTANATYGEADAPRPGTAESGLDLSVPVAGGPGVSIFGVTEFAVMLHEAVSDDATIRHLLAAPAIAGAPSGQLPASYTGDDAARLRQALEQTAWRAGQFFKAMTEAGVPHGPLFTTGGWTRSAALVELRASMFGEPVTVLDEPELTALGASLFAAEAAWGAAPDFASHHQLKAIAPRKDWAEAYAAWERT